VDYDKTRTALEALHHYGFSVTIHSPLTSPDARYMVTAYGLRDETLRASHARLGYAIQAVARQLGAGRLSRYGRDALSLTREGGAL
jgi:hypothetical protein